jgi:glucokinase
LEATASATALKGMLREALGQGRNSYLKPEDDLPAIAHSARNGDSLALGLFRRAGRAMGRGIVNSITLTGIRLVVIGGGLSETWDLMEAAALEEIKKRFHIVDPSGIRLGRGHLGEEAPLFGAAAWAEQEIINLREDH